MGGGGFCLLGILSGGAFFPKLHKQGAFSPGGGGILSGGILSVQVLWYMKELLQGLDVFYYL